MHSWNTWLVLKAQLSHTVHSDSICKPTPKIGKLDARRVLTVQKNKYATQYNNVSGPIVMIHNCAGFVKSNVSYL